MRPVYWCSINLFIHAWILPITSLVAIIALTTYIYLTLVAFNSSSGVLSLPGLAALVLGVGMAVDANIIMYERIKDELRIGRTIKQAFSKANKSSFLTIFDSNLTTVIAAAVLFFFGESSVKGFATMLLLGILNNLCYSRVLIKILIIITCFIKYIKNQFWLFGVKKNRHDR
ncbi:MMPL family transporter [Staphylococcus aureus]